MNQTILIAFFLIIGFGVCAQDEPIVNTGNLGSGGYAFGLKGGPAISTQTWNGYQRNALLAYHIDVFSEIYGQWKEGQNGLTKRSSLQVQLGYHQKGSSFRNLFISTGPTPSNVFHNISFALIGKGAYELRELMNAYYGLGLRLDYTLDYQLIGFGVEGVNRFNYGVWLGGGVEFELKKGKHVFFVEGNISPDLSRQVFVPAGFSTGIVDINGNPILTQEQKVLNLVLEVSFGVKL